MNKDPFYALSSPYRREIIKLLKWQNMSAGDIASNFSISKPSLSRHFEILKNAEIISEERRGNVIIYSLNLDTMHKISGILDELFNV